MGIGCPQFFTGIVPDSVGVWVGSSGTKAGPLGPRIPAGLAVDSALSCGEPSPDTSRKWSSHSVAVETKAAAAHPTWPRGWWQRPLRPSLQRYRYPRGYLFLQLSCARPASFYGQPQPPPREAEAARRLPEWKGGWAPWPAATHGHPSAPVVATTESCQPSRATSASAAGGTARVPSAP